MLFNKEFNCDKCNAIINKKSSCTIDYSHQKRYKNGKEIRMLTESAEHSWDNYAETEFYNYMQSLLPSDNDKCNFCSKDAIYTWCDLRIYCGEDPFSIDIPEIQGEKICVCPNCIGDLFRNKIENDKINLTYVFPMLDESGYYTPWEA